LWRVFPFDVIYIYNKFIFQKKNNDEFVIRLVNSLLDPSITTVRRMAEGHIIYFGCQS
jgi:hypothetical protein